MGKERERLDEAAKREVHWRKWGPYLSARQWGTVREDYSANGDAWDYFTFDEAGSRAYRWGEDGIGGFCDNHQRVCLSFAFWNGKDPILKERYFGLSNDQGNHGEDVKEYYYYLDGTPTHSYMKMLYKYPQEAFPYGDLVAENGRRGATQPEYELIDTGIFDGDRYFDLTVEYAKGTFEDILVRLRIANRGDEAAEIHVLPQLWLRNTWSWSGKEPPGKISLGDHSLLLDYTGLGKRYLYFEGGPEPLFTQNETNFQKVFQSENRTRYVKDAFQEAIVFGNKEALDPSKTGTKSGLHYLVKVAPQKEVEIRLRFTDQQKGKPFSDFDQIFAKRLEEADEFYAEFVPKSLSDERKKIQRQAFAGLLWSKQFYNYVIEQWLEGEEPPPPECRKSGRNSRWKHLYSEDVLSMPDNWEYPWFASWDLAFHMISFALLDPEFAKRQLSLLTREWYMHPNGQIPAYEWNFEDVNPPVTAWSAWRVYKIEQRKHGNEDRSFLEQIFQKLVMNFTWWVNRKDSDGRNVFEGGFLGLDNISIFNRSEHLPKGSRLTQSDATSWMGMFCLNMLTIAIELATREPSYEDMASKFFEHFLYIADAINFQHPDSPPLWDEEDGFYYDLLEHSDGSFQSLKVRSMVGLIPLFAVATIESEKLEQMSNFSKRFEWFLAHRKDLCLKVACMRSLGSEDRRLLSLLDQNKLKRILEKVLDENEFLSPHGIRSVSRYHLDHPFQLPCNGRVNRVDYEPGESTTRLYGGNSNWRGPVWFPLNYLLIESLQKYHYYYGDSLQVECPTGSGKMMNLSEVADEISRRLLSLFETKDGRRPIFGEMEKFQTDPHFKDFLFFFEHFHGDTGSGLGASHQTGWTALIAKLLQKEL